MLIQGLYDFPAAGPARPEDLGRRLRDQLFTAAELSGPTRAGLARQLQEAVQGKRYAEAAVLLEATLDTWPVAALVEEALAGWVAGSADPEDLDLLARAASLISVGRGWAPFARGPWPLPDPATLRGLLPEGASQLAVVVDDGYSLRLAAQLGLEPSHFAVLDAPVIPLDAERLLADAPALIGDLLRGVVCALDWRGDPPEGAEAQLAWGELRMEASHQALFERYGPPGVTLARAGRWQDRLLEPEPGTPGEHLKPVVTWAILPGTPATLAQGSVQPVCTLFFPGPRRPVPVVPVVAALLASLEGGGPPPPLRPEQRATVLGKLLELGAVSAG
ncbi:MAG: hypothetical protein H6741_23605 [Alphaproteobacteria bacterium]|nr:hypothetical protein [Alphaproteobacteria bacterium]MCB9795694.1 hypothetical protein [Alphaproteobacteria bacterium]